MIVITRGRQINALAPAVFAALADPTNLAGLVPRVRRIELLDRSASGARIVTHMALGPFGDLRSEGDVRWQTDREIVFSAARPVSVEARWTLTPFDRATTLQATLTLDLAPLIGPFAGLVPPREVDAIIGPDLEAALAEIARRVEQA